MKNLYIFLVVMLFSFSTNAQYIETFSTPEKGILEGPCGADINSCMTTDFSGVDWTITGNLTGIDFDDNFKTFNNTLTTTSGDLDEEVCWDSPGLDISGAGSVDFTADLGFTGFDNADYMDLYYSVDGAAFIIAAPNTIGTGGHTINGLSGNGGITGTTSAGATGISGSSLQIRMCVDMNSNSESFTLDNVSVPQANVAILPVKYSAFTAKEKNSTVVLDWSTHTEYQNDYFIVQHSADGKNFFDLGEVKGNINSKEINSYQYLHDEPVSRENYYRLVQYDLNGRHEVSRMIQVYLEDQNRTTEVKVFPNPSPSGSVLNISFHAEKQEDILLEIYDLRQNLQYSKVEEVSYGNNTLSLANNILASGMYVLKLKGLNITGNSLLIIQK